MKTHIIYFDGLWSNYIHPSLLAPLSKKHSFESIGFSWQSSEVRRAHEVDIKGARLFVVGHSFGGKAALQFCQQREHEVAGLVLLDPRDFPFGFPVFTSFNVPKSVKEAVNFYQTFPLRGYQVGGADNVRVAAGHTAVPSRPEVFYWLNARLG